MLALIGFLPSLAAGEGGGGVMRYLYHDESLKRQAVLLSYELLQFQLAGLKCLCSKHCHRSNREWQAKDSYLVSTGEY